MERVILHADANSYYAAVECLYTPALRGKPMAVCGRVEERHGIVLAKSEAAKRWGVKTGMAIWQARQRCPRLVCVPPDYTLYLHFSRKLRRIYEQYTGYVEPFGLDECWLDISQPGMDMRMGEQAAHQIRQQVKRELGITVSVGVSDNKVFAKLASDYRKPDAVTVISGANYQEVAWPLPVSDLLYVGPRTTEKLMRVGIHTIGDLARADMGMLEHRLGKNGMMLKAFAMGLDRSPVQPCDAVESIQSVGNSTTPPHDIRTMEEARAILYLLTESVCERLRRLGLRAKQVTISARGTDLMTRTCQRMLGQPTDGTDAIARTACALLKERLAQGLPYRSMGVACGKLEPADAPVQLDMLGEEAARRRVERLDRALDSLRYRFGHTVVRRGIVLADEQFAQVDPAGQTIHPAALLREGHVRYDRP